MHQLLTNDMHPSFGKLLEYHRNNLNLSREELSDGVCSSRYLSDIEKDKKKPTIYMVTLLCDKLNINLFDDYALLMQHHNIETHKRIVKLNDCVASRVLDTIKLLVSEYESLTDFQYGEPYFLLAYLKALILLYDEEDSAGAASLAYATLQKAHPDIATESFSNEKLSTGELNLFLIAASYSIDLGERARANKLYIDILSYLKRELSAPYYVINRKHHHEITLYAMLYYNYFSDFHDSGEYLEEYLDFLLKLQKKSDNEIYQSKLFFCKAYILLQRNEVDLAKTYYNAAYYTGLILLGEEQVAAIQEKLFPDGNPFS